MLSVVILVADARVPDLCPPGAVARTLASLTPAVVDGLVRDATLATLTTDPAGADIADEAGCALATADRPESVLNAGLAMARGDALLVIRAGYAPGPGFCEEASDLIARWPAAALMRVEPDGFVTRLAPQWANVAAVMAPRARLRLPAADFNALARALRTAPTMRTRLRRVA